MQPRTLMFNPKVGASGVCGVRSLPGLASTVQLQRRMYVQHIKALKHLHQPTLAARCLHYLIM
jgi:hypothetical protein